MCDHNTNIKFVLIKNLYNFLFKRLGLLVKIIWFPRLTGCIELEVFPQNFVLGPKRVLLFIKKLTISSIKSI